MKKFSEGDHDLILYIHKEPKLLTALSDFSQTPKKDLLQVLSTRFLPESKGSVTLNDHSSAHILHYGYIQKKKMKLGKGHRIISIPNDDLKILQSKITHRLSKVPTSTVATGGERAMSHLLNAKMHRNNLFMYSSDIAEAFPSIDTNRIYSTLQGSLNKTIDLSYPYLSQEQRERFISTLTALTSYDNELPQGASTSTRILNIAMAKTDKQILSFLHNEQLALKDPVLTRYIDDITASRKDISSNYFEAQLTARLAKSQNNIAILEANHQDTHPNNVIPLIDELVELFGELCETNLTNEQRQMIESNLPAYKKVSKALMEGNDELYGVALRWSFYIDLLKAKLFEERGSSYTESHTKDAVTKYVQRNIRRIIAANGWEIKKPKEKLWYPGSHHELREVTGITLDPKGNMGIISAKMGYFSEFCRKARQEPNALPRKYIDASGNIDKHKIIATINGFKRYVEMVRGVGNLPSNFKHYYSKALEKNKYAGMSEQDSLKVLRTDEAINEGFVEEN